VAITNDWTTAPGGYEEQPPNNEAVSLGAGHIRVSKLNVRERMTNGGHTWADATRAYDGRHVINADGTGAFNVWKSDKRTVGVKFEDNGITPAAGVDVYKPGAGGKTNADRLVVRERAIIWTVPDTLELGNTNIPAIEIPLAFKPDGSVEQATVKDLRLFCRTAPTGSAVTVKIWRAGFAETPPSFNEEVVSNTIADGVNRGTDTPTISIATLTRAATPGKARDLLLPEITTIGSTTPGADLTIMLIVEF